jgi:hypothetical protein
METTADLNRFVADVTRHAWPFTITILVIALIATAIVQLAKDMSPMRRWFQQAFLRNWLRQQRAAAKRTPGESVTGDLRAAEHDLIHLATGGDVKAFYNLETEQLCGQMNAAAQIALAYASRHENLLNYLAPEADVGDLQKVVAPPDYISADRETLSPEQVKNVGIFLDARNRVTHHVQRAIDALQISMSFRWKLILQTAVYVICLGIAVWGVFSFNRGGRNNLFDAVVLGVIAGFISPIIRDLMAVLARLRKS